MVVVARALSERPENPDIAHGFTLTRFWVTSGINVDTVDSKLIAPGADEAQEFEITYWSTVAVHHAAYRGPPGKPKVTEPRVSTAIIFVDG